jgi:hypothetical protein
MSIAILLACVSAGCAAPPPPREIGKGRILEVVPLAEPTFQGRRVDIAVAVFIPIPSISPVATPWRIYTVRLLDGFEVRMAAEGQLLIGSCVVLHDLEGPPRVKVEAGYMVGRISPSQGCQ